ncbi:MBL fold metallo-hydrolase [Bacillus daqingensis]|uniref:MBL fold metallo-hydrolase n=1 Tax=Bacillus daqingensis TaxID=872396 RepID=A0ABV9P0M0_9BACI
MKIEQLPLGALQTNCYIIYEKSSAIVVDPGGNFDQLNNRIHELDVTVQAILLTHAHFDHIGALQEAADTWNCPVYLHEAEKEWLGDPDKNGSSKFPGIVHVTASEADVLWTDTGDKSVGDFKFVLMHTPGHSPGSVTYYFPQLQTAVSGDVLFKGGVGRTDLYEGDHDLLMETIHETMLSLPEDTKVLSGHGPETVIGIEMDTNPFINGFGW